MIGITTYLSGTKLSPLETDTAQAPLHYPAARARLAGRDCSRLPQLPPPARPDLTSPCSCQLMALAGATNPFSALNQTPAVLYCVT